MNITNIGRVIGQAAELLLNHADGIRTQVPSIKLPGLPGQVNVSSLGWLQKATDSVAPGLAKFVEDALTLGKVFQSHSEGNATVFGAHPPAGMTPGAHLSMRFDPAPQTRDGHLGYDLSGVKLSERDDQWLTPQGRSAPPLPPRPQFRPPALGLAARLSAQPAQTKTAPISRQMYGALADRAPSLEEANSSTVMSSLQRRSALSRPSRYPAVEASQSRSSSTLGQVARASNSASAALRVDNSNADALLKGLQSMPVHMPEVTPWASLPSSVKAAYQNELAYEVDVTQQMTTSSNDKGLRDLLAKHAMRVVPNTGQTGDQINNCFLISVMQHATQRFGATDDKQINQYREILADAGFTSKNEKMSSDSEAAKTFVRLINEDPNTQPKLDVHVISVVGGMTYVDRLGEQSPNSRKVYVLDQGGHFEAVAKS